MLAVPHHNQISVSKNRPKVVTTNCEAEQYKAYRKPVTAQSVTPKRGVTLYKIAEQQCALCKVPQFIYEPISLVSAE
ncbi:hypothetical protein GCM10027297_18240 [Parahaliea aestuarii]